METADQRRFKKKRQLATCGRQMWKVFKAIMDIILFAISISAMSGSCMNSSTLTAYTLYVFFIAMVFMISSVCEFIVFNHKTVKSLFKKALCCQHSTRQTNSDADNAAACMHCLWFLVMLPLGFLYLLAYLIISGARLFDIRQCFWRQINYNLNNFLSFMFKVGVYIYSFSVIVAGLAACNNGALVVCLLIIGKSE